VAGADLLFVDRRFSVARSLDHSIYLDPDRRFDSFIFGRPELLWNTVRLAIFQKVGPLMSCTFSSRFSFSSTQPEPSSGGPEP
jgi:hypothetical protein